MDDENSKTEYDRTLAEAIAEAGVLNVEQAAAVTLQLAEAVRDLHAEGKVHRQICADTVRVGRAMSAKLETTEQEVTLGGIGVDLVPCPPPLQNMQPVSLPAAIDAAQQALTEAGILLNPQQIDFYQLGALLCFMTSGHNVSEYLRSCKAKAAVPQVVRPIIDRALGLNSKDCFQSADSFISELEAIVSGKPPAKSQPSSLPDSIFAESLSKSEAGLQPPRDARAAAGGSLPFEKLGHYRIIERIGHGGMGDVYKGYEQALDRFVAIKVLPSEFGRQEDFVKRFHAEAAAIAKLDHPNVVRIYYTGQDQGHHFFAMQYVDGQTLADLLERHKKLTPSEALPIIEQCLAGIGAAHKSGLIHRDIKPGNVLLDRCSRRALVTDFGVVKAIQAQTQITVTGTVMGTADYIAPEQARGQDIDSHADLYAMGVLIYQMLSGRLPFQAESATSMMFQHAYEPPPPLAEVAPDVPRPLADIVMKLMAKKPEDRYQSAAEILDELHRIRLMPAAASYKPRTNIVKSPKYDATPQLPADLVRFVPTGWLGRLRNWIVDFFGTHAPQAIQRMQTTGQQVDGAIAEYERQREQLAKLAEEAKSLATDLERQANSHANAAQIAAQRAEATAKTTAKHTALKQQQESEQAAAELAQLAAEQQQQCEDIEMRLKKLNAKLAQLCSQRNVLNARLNAAKARLNADQPSHSKWYPLKWLIHTAIIFLFVCFVVALVYFSWLIILRDDALIAHWKFDEGIGNIAYDSAGKNNGTIYGATWTSGKIDGALQLDGVDDFIETNLNIDQSGSTNITLAAWVYPTSLKGGAIQHIVSTDNGGHDWSLLIRGGKWQVFPGSYSAAFGFSVDLNRWQHVAAVFDVSDKKVYFYKNGVCSSITSELFTDTSTNNICIGDNPGWWVGYFEGKVDEVRIYRRALSAKKIQKLYESQVNTKPSAPSGLIAHWKFDAPAIQWKPIADLPGDQHGACAGVIDQLVYLVGGINPSGPVYNKMRIYDPTGDSWSDGPSMSTPRVNPGSGVIEGPIGPELYVVGGYSGYAGLASVERYTPSSETWQTVAPLGEPRGNAIMTAVVNNNLYAIGGHYNWGQRYATNQMYDRANNLWINRAQIQKDGQPFPLAGGMAAVWNNKIFILGGYPGYGPITTTLIYDTLSDTWSEGSEMPRGRAGGRAVAFGDYIYLMGFAEAGDPTIDVYDPVNDTWVTTDDYPGNNSWHPVIAQSDSLVYVLGDSWDNPTAQLECWVGEAAGEIPEPNGPIAHWEFDENSGTTAYDSAGSYDGDIYGAAWTTGQIGGALDFNGASDYVSVPHDAGLNVTGDITISAWVFLAREGGGNDQDDQAIVTKCVGTGAYNNPFDFRTHGFDSHLAFVRGGASGHEFVYSTQGLPIMEWHHVLVRVENKVPDFYFDGLITGKFADTIFAKTPTGNAKPLLIGRRDDGLHLDGTIDDVRIYDRALSASEISELAGQSIKGPVAYWKFDEGTGSIAHDSVGKNHGTIHGATWTTGKVGGALSFDGDGDVQTTLNIDQNGSTDITMMAWIYPTNKSTRQQHVVSSDNGGFDWSILRRHGKWHAFTGDGIWYSGFREDVDKWQHVAVVFKTGKDVVFYKNGERRSKGLAPGIDRSSNHVAIGDNPGYRCCFVGKIDEVRIYNKALSAKEIQQLYRAAAGTYEKPKSSGWVDILKLIDVERDARAGPWRLENGTLTGFAQSTLETTYELPAEYDVLWEFESNSTAINLLLASPAGKRFEWMMKGWSHNLCAIRDVGRKRANVNETTTVYPLASAVRYVTEVRVRKDRFVALIDGEEILNYKTDWSNIEVWDHWHQFELKPGTLGIWLHKHWTKTHRLQVKPHN